MNIQFDTQSFTPDEALGLIALLEALIPVNFESGLVPQPGQSVPAINPTPAPPATFPEQLKASIEQISAASPQPVEESANTVQAINEAPARTRRTKAQIAADEAAAKAASATEAPAATEGTAGSGPEAAPATVSADELRSLLSNFITRHSMDDAIGKLKAFGCNRVTEAINLEPVKLSALAAELRG